MKKFISFAFFVIVFIILVVNSIITYTNYTMINNMVSIIDRHEDFIAPILNERDEYQNLKSKFQYECEVTVSTQVGDKITPCWDDAFQNLKLWEDPSKKYHYLRYSGPRGNKILYTNHPTNFVCDICKDMKKIETEKSK